MTFFGHHGQVNDDAQVGVCIKGGEVSSLREGEAAAMSADISTPRREPDKRLFYILPPSPTSLPIAHTTLPPSQ